MRGSSHKAPGGCTAPLDTPLPAGFCFTGASIEEMLQPLGPSPGATSLAAVSQPGDRLWAQHPRGGPPHLPRPQGVSPEEDAAVPAPCFGPIVERQDVRGEAALRGVSAGVPIACGGHGSMPPPRGDQPQGGSLSKRQSRG